jgi:hypothetical protein
MPGSPRSCTPPGASDVHPRSGGHLCGALHRSPPHIPSEPDPVFNRHHSTLGYRRLAGRRDACGSLRRSARADVYPHVRVRRQGDACTVRSTAAAGGSGPISSGPESDVHRCRPCFSRCGALLSIDSVARLCWFVPPHRSLLCRVVRGAHFAADLRERVRRVLSSDGSMVAETVSLHRRVR